VNADVSCDLCERLDHQLCENPQYAYCRKLGQLDHAAIFRITGNAYTVYCHRLCSLGQRLGDVKPASLSPLEDWWRYFHGEHVAGV
jgi:hypothetical protein